MDVLSDEELRALEKYSTPTIANAIEVFEVQDRTTGFLDTSIRGIVAGSRPMVGYASTAKMAASVPPAPEHAGLRRKLWEHVEATPRPRVVVIEDLDDPPVGAFWGEVQANIHRALGAAGIVTNGGVRDLDEVRELGDFRFFAGSVMVSHAHVHLVEVGTDVHIGGMNIKPGDLLHGDQHGVAVIPHGIARKIPEAAEHIERRERTIIDLCRSGSFSIETLQDVVQRPT